MKNNKGITLVALIITIIAMSIIVGISVSGGSDVLQKSKMTDYIGYMKLVKARADVVIEDEIFNGETLDSVNSFEESDVTNTIADKGYYIPTMQTIKWEQDDIASQGIDKSILGSDEYFVVVYDTQTMETRDVLYSTGCGLDGQRYYSLNDMETVINGGTPIVATTRPIVNLIKECGFENSGWATGTTDNNYVQFDSSIRKSGECSLGLYGKTNDTNGEVVSECATAYKLELDHVYYVCLYAKWSGPSNQISYYYEKTGGGIPLKVTSKIEDDWKKYSNTFSIQNYKAIEYTRVDNDNNYAENILWVDEICLVDLTATFGAGNEPDNDWCDANLEYGVTEVNFPTN